MLLFHFAFLKSLAERITTGARRRNQGRRGNVNVEASRIKKVQNKPSNVIEDKKEEIAEPKQEEKLEVIEEVKEPENDNEENKDNE